MEIRFALEAITEALSSAPHSVAIAPVVLAFLIIGAVGLVGGVASQAVAIKERRRASKKRSRELQRQGAEIQTIADEEEDLERQRLNRLLGETVASFAARGLKITGSAAGVVASSREEGEAAIALLRTRADRATADLFRQASNVREASRRQQRAEIISLTAGTVGAVGSIIGGLPTAKKAPASSTQLPRSTVHGQG